jgi:hypothetical protein
MAVSARPLPGVDLLEIQDVTQAAIYLAKQRPPLQRFAAHKPLACHRGVVLPMLMKGRGK